METSAGCKGRAWDLVESRDASLRLACIASCVGNRRWAPLAVTVSFAHIEVEEVVKALHLIHPHQTVIRIFRILEFLRAFVCNTCVAR